MALVELVTPSAGRAEGMGLHIIRKDAWVPDGLKERLAQYDPRTQLGQYIKAILAQGLLPLGAAIELLYRVADVVVVQSQIAVKVLRSLDSPLRIGDNWVEDYGVASRKVITTTGVEMLVDVFQSSSANLTFRWHAIGLSTATEAVGNVALGGEMTTLGYGSATRSSGSQTTGAAGPHVYETVGTVTIDNVSSGTPMVIQEHGIFKSSGVGSTGLWDRSLTGTQTLSTGDSLQITYSLTVNSGG